MQIWAAGDQPSMLAGNLLFGALSQECVSAAARAGRFKRYASGQIIQPYRPSGPMITEMSPLQ